MKQHILFSDDEHDKRIFNSAVQKSTIAWISVHSQSLECDFDFCGCVLNFSGEKA